MKKLVTLLLVSLFVVPSFASTCTAVPAIVATTTETSTGNLVLITPAADGNYRLSVYMERNGAGSVCASASWTDDLNNQTSSNVCTDSSAKGQFVIFFHATASNPIYLNVNSITAGSSVFAVLEEM